MKKLVLVLGLLLTACNSSEVKQPVQQIFNEPSSESAQEPLSYTILAPAKDEVCYELEFCTVRWETNDTRTINVELERENRKSNHSYQGEIPNNSNERQYFIDDYFFNDKLDKDITEERVHVVLVDLKTGTPLARSDHSFIRVAA